MMYEIYDVLKADPLIQEKVANRIKFYEYPPINEMNGVYIVIDPLDTPIPSDYGSNRIIAEEYLYQIEVWSKSSFNTKAVAREIRDVLRSKLGVTQYGSGLDEFDKDTKIFRDARRYRGKQYIN
ncbi:DUF3168 domain-containing protein [Priestia flexa]|uniref:DUF3168 domain-containing protein n=1 Tax=Priestia flexa TaxID=86664 RepID=UPI00240CE598|nr:DUF3168 domain-containing protein [Priestia flexa]WEZ09578.1 hypothetical protein P5663_06975 [Priestia flexa]